MNILQFVLFPFAILYDLVTSIRNWTYKTKLRGSVRFETNVISIGNLEVGGTGKTPLSEYMIKNLSVNFKVAFISRGYKRKSTGFRLVTDQDSATTVGDEPYQIYLKFHQKSIVAVSSERETAIPFILAEYPETQVFILDDAFQYRTVTPSLNILLTRFDRPFYKDFLLPSGRLRENRKNSQRADIIIVTKCPSDTSEKMMNEIEKEIINYSSKPVFFTRINYGQPKPLNNKTLSDKLIIISGIANSEIFESYCKSNFSIVEHINHQDHYSYLHSDFEKLEKKYGNNLKKGDYGILITEKDAVKWLDKKLLDYWNKWSVYYLPISIEFLKNEERFQKIVENSIKEYSLE